LSTFSAAAATFTSSPSPINGQRGFACTYWTTDASLRFAALAPNTTYSVQAAFYQHTRVTDAVDGEFARGAGACVALSVHARAAAMLAPS
jgi:hypothetical protein